MENEDYTKYARKYYNNKIKNDPEFYEKEKKRVLEYLKNRYLNDPEFRQKQLEKSSLVYQRKKQERLLKKQQEQKVN